MYENIRVPPWETISLEQNERQMLPLSKQYWIYSDPTKVGTETAKISFKL